MKAGLPVSDREPRGIHSITARQGVVEPVFNSSSLIGNFHGKVCYFKQRLNISRRDRKGPRREFKFHAKTAKGRAEGAKDDAKRE